VPEPGVPESFKVLIKELQSLGLDVKVLNDTHEEIQIGELADDEDRPSLDLNIAGTEDAPPVTPGVSFADFAEFDLEEDDDEDEEGDVEDDIGGSGEFSDFDGEDDGGGE